MKGGRKNADYHQGRSGFVPVPTQSGLRSGWQDATLYGRPEARRYVRRGVAALLIPIRLPAVEKLPAEFSLAPNPLR